MVIFRSDSAPRLSNEFNFRMSSTLNSAPSSIAVIVVNYGTAPLAVSAVESVLERQHGGRLVEIHLVDNASPNDDAAFLRETHAAKGWGERVTLHLENENRGFGRGNNTSHEHSWSS